MAKLLEALMGGAPAPAEEVTIQSGDTLSKIASRHGVSVDELVRINGIADANVIRVGQNIAVSEELKGAGFSFGEALSNLADKIPNPIPVQHRTYLRYLLGSNAPIEKDDFSPEAIEQLKKYVKGGGVNYYGMLKDDGGAVNTGRILGGEEESSNPAVDEIAYTLGRFGAQRMPDGSIRVRDTYDFHGTDTQTPMEIAKVRWDRGNKKAAALSAMQAVAPVIRKAIQRITFRDPNEEIPVDIAFSRDELRQ